MGSPIISRQSIVDTVISGISQNRQKSYLIEIPPSCNLQPGVIETIYNNFCNNIPLHWLAAQVSIDHFSTESELVNYLIGLWCKNDTELRLLYKEERSYDDLNTPISNLMTIGSCAFKLKRRLYIFFNKFEKIFRNMSGGLLACMRDLEQNVKVLRSVNASKLPYDELYRIRSIESPGFTSDYGQMHIQLSIGCLDINEARDVWIKETGLVNETRLEVNYFKIAFQESGGLPEAFLKAITLLNTSETLEGDTHKYKFELQQTLQSSFEGIFNLLIYCKEMVTINAISNLYLRCASHSDKILLMNHRWKNLLIKENIDSPTIKCDALGRKSLEICRKHNIITVNDPIHLYKQGFFSGCLMMLERIQHPNKLLNIATRLMCEVFSDGPKNLYFRPNVNWVKIIELSKQGIQLCNGQKSKDEFACWHKIAESHKGFALEKRYEIDETIINDNIRLQEEIEKGIIRIGIRIAAIKNDRNNTTAGYTSTPLIEELLRFYLNLVLRIKAYGDVFSMINDSELKQWWYDDKIFERPKSKSRLSAAEIGLAIAIVTAKNGNSFFNTRSDLHRVINDLDEIRNVLGHYVVSPTDKMVNKILDHSELIFKKICLNIDKQLSLSDIQKMASPPILFIEDL